MEHAWARSGGETVAEIRDKLTSLSSDLSAWDPTHFGNVRQEILRLQGQLQEMRAIQNRSGPIHAEIKIVERLTELYHREEILWRQHARLEWLMHGDKNTYFFHLRASRRRRKNQIKALQKVNGEWTDNVLEMENMATSFYQELYTSEGVHNMEHVIDTVPTKVTQAMNDMLNAPYSQKEVKTALFQMFPIKAPGPDGYPTHFFQHHWEICGDDVTKVVLKIAEGTDSAECINETILVLIPKVKDPTLLSQSRPINLCNVFFKIESNVLANRLKHILPKIIFEDQSVFVPGHLITDNVITSYECMLSGPRS